MSLLAETGSLISPLHAFILGVVEGITEYLPVSSTGHLIVASHLLGLENGNLTADQEAALQAFEIIIQSGAILAVVILYWSYLMDMLKGVMGGSKAGRQLFINISVSTLPILAAGFCLKGVIETYLNGAQYVVAALGVGGFLMIFLEMYLKKSAPVEGTLSELTLKKSVMIGLAQCLALWPGTSRSMVTILAGMFMGLKRSQAAEFSFLLGLPALLAASIYKGYKNYHVLIANIGFFPMLLAFLTSTIVAGISIKLLLAFLNKKGLTFFGVYRILLAIALFFYFKL